MKNDKPLFAVVAEETEKTDFEKLQDFLIESLGRVEHKLDELLSREGKYGHISAVEPAEPPKDGRAKSWTYVIRFWIQTPSGWELVADSGDPAKLESTGMIPLIVRDIAAQVHECSTEDLPEALSTETLKKRLTQLRNNLGKSHASVLRVEYSVFTPPDTYEEHLCQMDVFRVG